MAPLVPKLAYPIRLDRGTFAVVEQDSTKDIVGCCEVVARCPLGYLDHAPDMGMPDLTFTTADIERAEIVRQRIEDGEPRAQLLPDEQLDELVTSVTQTLEGTLGD